MKAKLMVGFFVAASAMFAGPRISIGIGFGAPVVPYRYYAPAPIYAAPVYAAPVYAGPVYAAPAYVPPPAPGYGYTWVQGYWFGYGPRRVWRPGYWAAPRHGYRSAYYGREFRR